MTKASSNQAKKRLRIIQKQIRRHNWDALWIVSPANRYYATGFSGSAGWVLIPPFGQPVLITDSRYKEQARAQCPGVKIIMSSLDPHQSLVNHLLKQKIHKLGFEDEQVPVRSWMRVKKVLKGLQGKPASGFIEAIRICKDSEEVKYIKRAVNMAEKAFTRVLPRIKIGVRELDVALHLEKEMAEAGAEGIAFPTIVAAGVNGAMPHAQPTQRCLRAGDLVVMDFGCKYRGYHSDLTRTIAVAKMTVKQQEYYNLVKKSQLFAQKEIFSGKFIAEADKKARDVFRQVGLDKHFIHSLGHGLGLEIHEAPKVSAFSKDRFDQGMVITCEPGIYIPGWGGIRIEDDLLVGEKEAFWLSRSSEQLLVVGRK